MTEVVFVNRKKAAPGWSDLFLLQTISVRQPSNSKEEGCFLTLAS